MRHSEVRAAPIRSTPSVPLPTVGRDGRRSARVAGLRLPLVVLLLVTALAGCSAGRSGSDSGSAGSLPAVEQQRDGSDGSEAEVGSSAEEAADQAAADSRGTGEVTQQVVVTGEASVRASDPVAALAELTATVGDLGGSVASSTTDTDGNSPSAWATVRVPAARYQELLDSLPELGTVISTSTTTEDVGQQVADLDARIEALGASVSRLRTLIDEASSTKDLLEAESQLTSRQAELDSLRAQRTYLADQVTLSTLSVSLLAERVVDDPGASVWQRSWEAFLGALRGIGVGLVWALPWLVVTAVVLGAVVLGNRLAARRRVDEGTPPGPGAEPAPAPVADSGGGETPTGGRDTGDDEGAARGTGRAEGRSSAHGEE